MIIEKREGGYLVQYNKHASECQHLVDALDIIDPDYRNEISDLTEAMFENWGVNRLTITQEEGYWRATAELAYEAVEATAIHPIAVIMKLLPYLMLCKAAQMLPELS